VAALRRGPRPEADRQRRSQPALLRGLIVAALVSACLFSSGCGGGSNDHRAIACNGSTSLCDRHLDQVAFAATHNAYAGADVPGFRFPQQDAGIPAQLNDGVRGLWIDAYYGLPGERVYTDTSRLNPKLNSEIEQQLGPIFTAAARKLRSQIARPQGE